MARRNVVYGYGYENNLIRYALWQSWDYRCYWCMTPKDFTDTAIDHIIPKQASEKDRAAMDKAFNLPNDYNVDDLINLAPICIICNGPSGKGSRDLSDQGNVGDKLKKAAELKPQVISLVDSLKSNRGLTKAMLKVAEADLSDPKARNIYVNYMPGLVQRLAFINEELADFASRDVFTLDFGGEEELQSAEVFLNHQGRSAVALLENLVGIDVGQLLSDPIAKAINEMRDHALKSIESRYVHGEPVTTNHPVVGNIRLDLQAEMSRMPREVPIEITLYGKLQVDMSAFLTRQDDFGDDQINEQRDIALTCEPIALVYKWHPADLSDPIKLVKQEFGAITIDQDPTD